MPLFSHLSIEMTRADVVKTDDFMCAFAENTAWHIGLEREQLLLLLRVALVLCPLACLCECSAHGTEQILFIERMTSPDCSL